MDSMWCYTDVYTSVSGSNLATIEYRFRATNSGVATLMQDQITWALGACGRVMRPLIRVALALGLKHPQLEGMLRQLLLDDFCAHCPVNVHDSKYCQGCLEPSRFVDGDENYSAAGFVEVDRTLG